MTLKTEKNFDLYSKSSSGRGWQLETYMKRFHVGFALVVPLILKNFDHMKWLILMFDGALYI